MPSCWQDVYRRYLPDRRRTVCVRKITENISFEKGVKDLEISLEDKEVTVTYDPAKTDPDRLAEAIRSLGYTVERQKADDTVEKE